MSPLTKQHTVFFTDWMAYLSPIPIDRLSIPNVTALCETKQVNMEIQNLGTLSTDGGAQNVTNMSSTIGYQSSKFRENPSPISRVILFTYAYSVNRQTERKYCIISTVVGV